MNVAELVAAYLAHAEDYYRKPSGRQTSEPQIIRSALRFLADRHGQDPAASIRPVDITRVRDNMVAAGVTRSTANAYTARILRCYKWACDPGQALLPPETIAPLQAVRPLKYGRSQARETQEIDAAPDADVAAVLAMLQHDPQPSRQRLYTMIALQRGTAMRPGELCGMVREGIDTGHTDGLWRYTPPEHKTEHHGHQRTVFIQQAEQALLTAYMDRIKAATAGPIFGITVRAYRSQLNRACWRADVRPFNPHQLRHTAATILARTHPLKTVSGILGHRTIRTTEIYAKQTDAEVARALAEKILEKSDKST